MRKKIGIYFIGTECAAGGSGRKSVALATKLASKYDVTLISDHCATPKELENLYGESLRGVKLFELRIPVQRAALRLVRSRAGRPLRFLRADSMLTNLRCDIDRIYHRQVRDLGLDVFINNGFASNMPCPARCGIYMCMFPHPMKGHPRPDYGVVHGIYDRIITALCGLTPQILDSYDVITANSRFTGEWIEKMWKRRAVVLYSAASDMGPSGRKQKVIINVGRFVGPMRSDYKHQLTLLEVFRDLPELHKDNWELHFIGALHADEASRRMLDRLRSEADGLPVHLHLDPDFEALRALYRCASIYWHATGFGTSAELQPRSQEHFGMTTVEAMSAGAVPVVIDSGGQREIVEHRVTGFRWKSLDELCEATLFLARDRRALETFSVRAVSASAQFGTAAFVSRLESLLDSLN